MLEQDFLYSPFSSAEEYFRHLFTDFPSVYNNPLYSLFGHLFITAGDSSFINGIPEQTNRFFPIPLLEDTFKNLAAIGGCSVVFSRHSRYIPSRFHCHGYFEMIYQYRGFSQHNINGYEFRTKPGDLIILTPYTYHSVISPCDDGLAVNIGIKLSDFPERYPYILNDNSALSLFFRSYTDGKKTYDFILFETDEKTLPAENILRPLLIQKKHNSSNGEQIGIYLQSAVHQIFASLLLFCEKYTLVPYTNKNTDTLIKIMLYIKNNYRTVDLSILANEFHFTEPYLSRMIKSGTGCTFSELLCNIRLNSSLLILEKTKLPIAEIAAMVGYKAPENYMRNFKAVYGITPSEHRKLKNRINEISENSETKETD